MPEVERRLRETEALLPRPGGRPPPPTPNSFQIAALVVGLMVDRVTLGGGVPDKGELLEVQDLLQAGQQLLLGGRRSGDWQRTHHATDAAEEAEATLQATMQTRGSATTQGRP